MLKALICILGVAAAFILIAILSIGNSASAAGEPTCSSTLDVAVHGQHVVGDYVTGIGRDAISWPPTGSDIHEALKGEGVAIKGGPGPGFHFEHGFAAGASFCLAQAKSPGDHAGP